MTKYSKIASQNMVKTIKIQGPAYNLTTVFILQWIWILVMEQLTQKLEKKRHDFFDGTDVEDGYNYQRKKSLFRSRITISMIKKVTNVKMNLIIKLDNVRV